MKKSGLKPVNVSDVMRSINVLLGKSEHQAENAELELDELRLPRVPTSFHVPEKDGYEPEELLRYHDEEFIQAAYYAVLRRAPDPQGKEHYLRILRTGKNNKKEILGMLMASKEAKRYGVKVKGIGIHGWIGKAKRIPAVGFLLEWLIAFLTLPRKFRHLQEHTNYLIAQNQMLAKQFNETADLLEERLRQQEEQQQNETRKLAKKHHELQTQMDQAIQALDAMDAGIEDFDDQFYSVFQDVFRGTREDIQNRLKAYLPYLNQAGQPDIPLHVLDLGCGRGEWLELMKQQGHHAIGVDKNFAFVHACRAIGLDVVHDDMLNYLRNQPGEKFDVITGFHIIEHLPFRVMLKVFDECQRLLKPGGLMIFETPNPENMLVSTLHFHLDHTHQRPLVPDLLAFIARQKGFSKAEILRLNKRKEPEYTGNPYVDEIIYKVNMEQDFAIIAQK
jgi:O-antigen chain-terminating methyltransferase